MNFGCPFYVETKASPAGGSCHQKVTDEGRVSLYCLLKGYCGKFAPHPALRATFPLRGRHFYSNSKSPATSSSKLASGSATKRFDWFRIAFSSVLRAMRPLPFVAASSACLRSK